MGKYKDFVDKWGEHERGSAFLLSRWLSENFHPNSVVDIGCGSGIFLWDFMSDGKEVLGIDFEENARKMLGEDFIQGDLSESITFQKKYDLALSIEVVEHIDKQFEKTVIENIAKSSDLFLFSGAKPGQVGENHINCGTKAHWLNLFSHHGVYFWGEKTGELLSFMKRESEFEKCPWLIENLMILRRQA